MSVQTIKNNIISSYLQLNKDLPLIKYSAKKQDFKSACQKIADLGVQRLVFVESNPHPLAFLEQLLFETNQVNEFCFHVYGNVAHYSPEWLKVFKLLKGKRVKVVVASEAQKGQLKAFLGKANESCIEICPFPIKPSVVKKSRNSARKSWNLNPKDFVLVYAGRISLMKNLNLLIDFLAEFSERNPKLASNMKLLIAGDFDDVGANFLHLKMNEYFFLWNQWYQSLDEDFKKKITFLGFQKPAELQSLLLSSDLFVSLSTFHDEDFGMAPLEALSLGTPAILTGWGGYKDFAFDSESVQLVPVRNSNHGLQIDFSAFERALTQKISARAKEAHRRLTRKKYQDRYEISKVGFRYRKIHGKSFTALQSVSPTLKRHAEVIREWRSGRGIVYPQLSKQDTLYTKLYRLYYENEKSFSNCKIKTGR